MTPPFVVSDAVPRDTVVVLGNTATLVVRPRTVREQLRGDLRRYTADRFAEAYDRLGLPRPVRFVVWP